MLVLRDGCVDRIYRPDTFPWIEPAIRQPVPSDSLAAGRQLAPRELTPIEECEPDVWFGERAVARIDVATEQILGQNADFAMVLLRIGGDVF
jgi:hypothetical protein